MFLRTISLWLTLVLISCGGGGGGGSSNATPASANPPSAPVAPAANPITTIDVLGLITPGVEGLFVDSDLRIQHLFNVANDVLSDNGADLNFELVHLEVIEAADGGDTALLLEDLTYGADPFENVAALRDQYSADLIVLFRPYANDGRCGYAWIGGFSQQGDFSDPAEADFGYSVVAANCGDYTLLHELGHNLGLAHSRRETDQGGTYMWSVGYGVEQDFVTIMASPSEFNASRMPKFSSPNSTCNDQPCGINHQQDQGADALRSIEIVKDQVANYR